MRRENYVLPLIILAVICVGWIANGQATILTTAGHELIGSVSGINMVVRLNIVPAAGPVTVFDVPRTAIRQITIDFPRIIVETKDKVCIGPFSDFTGLKEIITLEEGGKTIAIPLAGLRAITLNGNALHQVPREWLGSGFLTKPLITVRTGSPTTLRVSQPRSEHPINWAKINPSPVLPPEEGQGTPWWIGMLIAVGIASLIYFSLTMSTG